MFNASGEEEEETGVSDAAADDGSGVGANKDGWRCLLSTGAFSRSLQLALGQCFEDNR